MIIERLNQIAYKKIIWILAITETLHNLEEAVWLPKWSQTAGIWQPVGTFEFRFAVIVVTLVFYGIIYYFSVSKSKLSGYMLGGALVMVLVNVLIPHIIAVIFIRRYVPGVITGIILNVPATLYLLQRGIKEGIYDFKILIKYGIAFSLIVLPLLQISFCLGRTIESML